MFNIKWVWLSAILYCANMFCMQQNPLPAQAQADEKTRHEFCANPIESSVAPRISAAKQTVIQNKYAHALRLEEQAFMKEFFELAQIRPGDWKAIKDKYLLNVLERDNTEYLELSKLGLKLDPHIEALIEKILFEHQIHPTFMKIMRDKDSADICSCGCTYIAVNQYLMKKLPLITVESIITHEVMHKLYDDSFTIMVMLIFLQKIKNINDNEMNKAHAFEIKWRHFIERRADIMAALKSLDHVNALIKYLEQSIDERKIDHLHPAIQERIKYLTQVRQEMIAARSMIANSL